MATQVLYEIFVATRYADFLSGMAEGADTRAVPAVLASKKEDPARKLYCVLPCGGRVDGRSASARELYFSILVQANEVVYVSRDIVRAVCWNATAIWSITPPVCWLVYNGEWRGGTAMTVRYARKKGRRIIIINPV